jgi:hypothetical protein
MLKRTTQDFYRALRIQYHGVRLSASSMDIGFIGEAARLANSIFLLLGRGMKGHTSIVDHLEASSNVFMPTTVRKDSKSGSPLVVAHLCVVENVDGKSAVWQVSLRAAGSSALQTGQSISLDQWWSETVIRAEGCVLDRQTLIRVMRDKDGGAHYDETLTDANYIAASTKPVAFSYTQPDGTVTPIEGLLEMSVRQMAEEVLQGLKPVIYQAEKALS